eukprot:TRINITY_DN30371_c0_g1_i1.p1 TRINITY_DN30371_c0_g1~~TRINITY_DN30371_c0_g1_i1.p1  ORF type:complete len:415 (+),score=89.93 TRINITY_DN30371_c0_g1_i1:72-1316(+)
MSFAVGQAVRVHGLGAKRAALNGLCGAVCGYVDGGRVAVLLESGVTKGLKPANLQALVLDGADADADADTAAAAPTASCGDTPAAAPFYIPYSSAPDTDAPPAPPKSPLQERAPERAPATAPKPRQTGRPYRDCPRRTRAACRPPPGSIVDGAGRTLAPRGRGGVFPVAWLVEKAARGWIRQAGGVGTLVGYSQEAHPPRAHLPEGVGRGMNPQVPHDSLKGKPVHVYHVAEPMVREAEAYPRHEAGEDAESVFFRIGLRYSAASLCVVLLRVLATLRRRGWACAGIGAAVVDIDTFRVHTVDTVPKAAHYVNTRYPTGHNTVELLEDSHGKPLTHQVLVNAGFVVDPAGAWLGNPGHRCQTDVSWLAYERGACAQTARIRPVPDRPEWIQSQYTTFQREIDGLVAALEADIAE